MKVVGFSGSLRKNSLNTWALRAAQKLAPEGMSISIADISQVPLYNEDVRETSGDPAAVTELKAQLSAADALIIVTPEYSHSMPGVLKNVLDWLARPPQTPFQGKAVAIMGASTGPVGTARVQYHLRQVLNSMGAYTLSKPEVFTGMAVGKFSAEGELTDETTKKFISEWLVALQKHQARVG